MQDFFAAQNTTSEQNTSTPNQALPKPLAYLSAARAVRVNTDMPTDVSWINGISLHPVLPKSHSSARYRLASTGAQVTRSNTSPNARLHRNKLGTLRMDLTAQNVRMSVKFPTRPARMISAYAVAIATPACHNAASRASGELRISHDSLDADFSSAMELNISSKDMVEKKTTTSSLFNPLGDIL